METLKLVFHDTNRLDTDRRANNNPKAYELKRVTLENGKPISSNVSAKDWLKLKVAAKPHGLSIISIFSANFGGIEGTYAKVAKVDLNAPKLAA
jgi:hypothetical protein